MVARDDQEDPACPGDRDALRDSDCVSCRFRWCESAVPGRRVSGPVRRKSNLLLQLGDAPLPAHPADRSGDGSVHRGRRLSTGALRRDPDGEGDFVHGTRWTQSRERRDRPGHR